MAKSPFDWMQVGHWTDSHARTGCTVITFTGNVVASGEVRGGAPATREFALLEPTKLVQGVHAVVLSGGSAFGLAAADGVARTLRTQDIGFPTAHGRVPIVVALSLYDLGVGNAMRWPGVPEGNAAFHEASANFDVGVVGAGTGATAGKWRGSQDAYGAGLGFAECRKDDLVVSAVIAANPAGDIGQRGVEARNALAGGSFEWPEVESPVGENTTIGLIATNAVLTKSQCRSVAEAGHDGLARAIFPAHGPTDGDALIAVAKPEVEAEEAHVRSLAAMAVEMAILSVENSE